MRKLHLLGCSFFYAVDGSGGCKLLVHQCLFPMRPTLMLLLLLAACQQPDVANTKVITYEQDIPHHRKTVNPNPVAAYEAVLPSKSTFRVSVFQTSLVHQFRMKLEHVNEVFWDTLRIPAFNSDPQVRIEKGKTASECVVGFLNKEGRFMPHKKVFTEGANLQVKVLQRYGVTTTQVKSDSFTLRP